MDKIILGNKEKDKEYYFRETCFGIVYKNNNFYITIKNNDYSLIGGGIEEGESHIETLKREYMEEAGLEIENATPLITIDCYWVTRHGHYVNSLAHFYIVSVSDKENTPLEQESSLVKVSKEEILSKLFLPYQIKAVSMYLDMI